MRKFYSIVLMAAALLVGTNVKAAVSTWEDLADAIANAESGVLTQIELGASITGAGRINVQGGKQIELDLKGFNITSTADYMIIVANGSLELKNTGAAGGVISGSGWAAYMQGSNDDVANYAVLNIGAGVKLTTTNAYGIVMYQGPKINNATSPYGYGMVVDIWGELRVESGNALWVMGNIQEKEGNYLPQVNIHAGATVVGSDAKVCLYGGGYAIFNIEGTVQGGTGIYAKAGKYNISGNAKIIATATAHEEVVPNGNGYTGGMGCAIISDSKNGYAGGMQINISGNATLESEAEGGYAIEEVKSDADQSKTESLVISGGTINGDLSATMELKENVKLNGTITGGTYKSSVDLSEYIDATATDLVDNGDGTYSVKVAVQITVNSAGFSTFSSPKQVKMAAGLVAYRATGLNGNELSLVAITNSNGDQTLPANCGVLLYGSNGTLEESTDQPVNVGDNCLRPATAWDANYAGVAYILHGSELWIYDGEEFPANKAFFLLQDPNGAPERIRLVFAAEDEATAIDNVETTVESVKFVENGQLFIRRGENIYNVQGQIVK